MQKTLQNTRLHDFVGSLSSLGMLLLALIGMGGIVYHALAPAGLISAWLARIWTTHPGLAVLVVIGIITMALTARARTLAYRTVQGNSDLPLYVFVALGTVFAVNWLW